MGAPVAAISATPTTSGAAPLTVSFADLSTGSPDTWAWDFGNGQTSTQQNPGPIVFASVGTFTVTLTATNSSGTSTATTTVSTNAACLAPTASFTVSPMSGRKNDTQFDVTDASTNMSTAGCNAQWSWDFGDGQGSTLQSPPNHVYSKRGDYTIQFRSRTSAARRSFTRLVTVSNSPRCMVASAASGGQRAGTDPRGVRARPPDLPVHPHGVFDFGQAIYMYNGVSQASRELARATSVHRCAGSPCTLGNSAETQAVLATQKSLIPNLQNPTYTCVDIDGSTINSVTTCLPGNQCLVRIVARYSPITPLLGLTGMWDLQSTSSVSIQ